MSTNPKEYTVKNKSVEGQDYRELSCGQRNQKQFAYMAKTATNKWQVYRDTSLQTLLFADEFETQALAKEAFGKVAKKTICELRGEVYFDEDEALEMLRSEAFKLDLQITFELAEETINRELAQQSNILPDIQTKQAVATYINNVRQMFLSLGIIKPKQPAEEPVNTVAPAAPAPAPAPEEGEWAPA